jgi:3-oxoacyl-[acyl-carrier protein] reductase
MNMRLKGKIAIVTGAGSGFGEGIAKRFTQEGASVVVADVDAAAGERVTQALRGAGASAVFTKVDVSRSDDVKSMVETCVKEFGRIDIMVNNAGVSHPNRPLLDVSEAMFDRVYAVNCKSLYLAAIHGVPVFRRQGGGVMLNVASTAGVRPRPGLTWYNGSKGAAILLTKSMAVELAPDKIRVNAINPVIGETGLLTTFMGMEDTPENRKKFIATIPLGRMSRPSDIANAALFLASDEAEFITGVCMEVDGGRCI